MKRETQSDRLYELLMDGERHSTAEILDKVYGRGHSGYCNIHGRVSDLRKKYGLRIINTPDENNRSLTYYQIKPIEFQEIPKEDFPPKPKFEDMPEYQDYHKDEQLTLM